MFIADVVSNKYINGANFLLLRKNFMKNMRKILIMSFIFLFSLLFSSILIANDQTPPAHSLDDNEIYINVIENPNEKPHVYAQCIFDPKYYQIKIAAAKTLLSESRGEKVSEIAQDNNAIAGINGGSFNVLDAEKESLLENAGRKFARLTARIAHKLDAEPLIQIADTLTKYWKRYNISPSAILIVDNVIFSDTDNYLPAMGIDSSGNIEIGEVKVVWEAIYDGYNIPLDRCTTINSTDLQTFTIYYKPKSNSKIIAISVEKNIVVRIEEIDKPDENKPGGYWLHKLTLDNYHTHQQLDYDNIAKINSDNIAKLDSIEIGHNFSCNYKLIAQNPNQTDHFNECRDVLSGGRIIINNGEIVNYNTDSIENIVCARDDGKIALLSTLEGVTLNMLKELQCKQVISFDAGGSTTFVSHEAKVYKDTGEEHIITNDKRKRPILGYNRIVTDAILVIPK
jgi:hypothetical protein